MTQNTTAGNGGDEHSTPSLDPNHSITQLHAQQRQQRIQQGEASLASTEQSQERNLITFTPTPPNSIRGEGTVEEGRTQELNIGGQQTVTPLPQRENVSKKSSHDTNPPEPTTSARQEVPRTDQVMGSSTERAPNSQPVTDVNEFCWSSKNPTYVYQYHKRTQPYKNVGDAVKKATARKGVTDKFHAHFVKFIHTQQKPARNMPALYETARVHQVKERLPYKAK